MKRIFTVHDRFIMAQAARNIGYLARIQASFPVLSKVSRDSRFYHFVNLKDLR